MSTKTDRGEPPFAQIERVAVLVLGMHRSGTSALSGVLASLGVAAPCTLMDANALNPRGYWESTKLMQVHDEILASAGTRWDDWDVFNPRWINSPIASEMMGKLDGAIEEEFGSRSFLLVKDPRICRMFPVWKHVLQKKQIGIKIVIPVRNPLDVARSLEHRNGFTTSKSLLLWLRHVLDAEHATRSESRVFVSYEEMLTSWKPVVSKIGTALSISWPRWSATTDVEVGAFLSSQFRHHSSNGLAELPSNGLGEWVAGVYEELKVCASTGSTRNLNLQEMDRIRTEFDKSSSVFAVAFVEQEAKAKQAKEEVSLNARKLKAQVDEVKERLEQREEEYASALSQTSGERDRLQAALKDATDSLKQEEEKTKALSAELHEATSSLEVALASLAKSEEEMSRQLASLDAELDKRASEISMREAEISRCQEEIARLCKLVLEQEAKLAEFDDIRGSMADLQSELDETRANMADLRSERDGLQSEAEGLRAAHERINLMLEFALASKEQLTSVLEHHVERMHYDVANIVSAVDGVRRSPIWRVANLLGATLPVVSPVRVARPGEIEDEIVKKIRDSGLFDEDFYLSRNPEAARTGMDAVLHYVRVGVHKCADPSDRFSTFHYLKRYRDVRRAGVNPLLHYIEFGKKEGRDLLPGGQGPEAVHAMKEV